MMVSVLIWGRLDRNVSVKRWKTDRKYHQLNGQEFEKQGSRACCGPWDQKELDMT